MTEKITRWIFILVCLILGSCAAPQILQNYSSQHAFQQRALALFLDGTANNVQTRTHVRQLFEIVSARNRPDIITYYNDGVGGAIYESTGAIATLGSAAARGISRDIRQAFGFLTTHYQTYSAALLTDISSSREKANNAHMQAEAECEIESEWDYVDTVYLFGFSRGAFTARSLIGLVNWYGGVPDFGYCNRVHLENLDAKIFAIYSLYRLFGLHGCHDVGTGDSVKSPSMRCEKLNDRLEALRRRYPQRPVTFHFVGLWDTVRTIGHEALSCAVNDRDGTIRDQHWFHRGEDFRNTTMVFHAVSSDEQRDCYNHVPLQITATGYLKPQFASEVWFSGDHSDIGGGHSAHKGLSGITMNWMLDNLQTAQRWSREKMKHSTSLLPKDMPADFVYENPCEGFGNLSGAGIFGIMGVAKRIPPDNAVYDETTDESYKANWKKRYNVEKCQFERPY